MIRSAAREEFGPCFVSATWEDLESPALVSVVVTRQLPSGQLMAATALVDRTCLGVKDGFALGPKSRSELSEIVEQLGFLHGGMVECSPLVVQSIVFHAIDYARSLGFEPHRDFPAALFGPRPVELMPTPWHAPEPIYVSGPHDDVPTITSKLAEAFGANGFEQTAPTLRNDEFGLLGQDDHEDAQDEGVYSPLERRVSRGGAHWDIFIYRGRSETMWILEIEDQHGTSYVWDEQFETDRMALDAALRAIENDSVERLSVESDAATVSVTEGQQI